MDAHDSLLTTVAARVRELSAERGVTLTHVADFSGRSRSHFWDIMAGRKSPTLRWLVGVAQALEVEPWELLRPSGQPHGS